MKLTKPKNSNYAAVVVRLRKIDPIPNRDRIVTTPLIGYQAIIGIDACVGDMGIVFPPEVQLSEAFCRENNLFRHNGFNSDKSKSGYIEDNRRVKALKLGPTRSDCLFMPLESLLYTGVDITQLTEGDCFDELNSQEICQKYEAKKPAGQPNDPRVKFSRVDKRVFPEMVDVDNYFRVSSSLDQNADVIVTQKLHGTSARYGHIPVGRKLSFFEKIVSRLGVKISKSEFAHIDGSHHVIKDRTNPGVSYYGKTDLWGIHGEMLDSIIPKGMIVYGEIVGFTDSGKAVQTHYTYDAEQNQSKFYCYRISFINEDGIAHEMEWDSVVEWCENNNVNHVSELWRGSLRDFNADEFMNKDYSNDFPQAVKLSPDSPCDEGVVIRIGHLKPRFLKAKSSTFLAHETELLDVGDEGVQEVSA